MIALLTMQTPQNIDMMKLWYYSRKINYILVTSYM